MNQPTPISPPRTLLARLSLRYLARHPWQSVLMVLGVMIGVAVVVAIDLANASAARAFDLSTDAVVGRATHQIVAGPQGLPEEIYIGLRRQGITVPAAPVISVYFTSPQLGDQPFQLLGIDPFSDAPFRDYLGAEGSLPLDALSAFLTRPGALLISSDVARRFGLQPGDPLELEIAGVQRQAFVADLLEPADRLSQRALEGLILTDIASAQELTGRQGWLDRVDLILPAEDPPTLERLQSTLPAGTTILPVAARQGTVAEMTAAFRLNLTALSLLALVVGMFLIYNTMTFSVIRRRALFGTLRSLGMRRQEIFILVVGEALVIGLLSAGLGLLLGIALGQGALRLVTRTINDLYFVVTVQRVEIPASSLLKGALVGVLATLFSTVVPAWEAASVPPRDALLRSALESRAWRLLPYASAGGGAVILAGVGMLAASENLLGLSFLGTLTVVVGFAMLTPGVTMVLMRLAGPLTGRLWGALGRMAPREVAGSLSRTAVAVAALMVAVSVIIGVSLMVASFRTTVVTWLSQSLQGDVYISPPSLTAVSNPGVLAPEVLTVLESWPGVQRVDTVRSVQVDSPQGPIHVAAINNPHSGEERLYKSTTLPPNQIDPALKRGAVLVSEPLANRLDLPAEGASVTLYTRRGPRDFPIVGVYYDYASSQGTVLMAQDVYQAWWEDPAITAAALRLDPGVEADEVVRQLQVRLAPIQRLLIRPNQALRAEVLEVFDRTFEITAALQLLATAVAFIGVLSALLSLQLEKGRQLGILRAVGLSVGQMWRLILLETGLMGGVAGLLAMPTGLVLSLILVYIINRRSFGWTLQMDLAPAPFLQALGIAVVAALLAGLYPAWRLSRRAITDAIRFE